MERYLFILFSIYRNNKKNLHFVTVNKFINIQCDKKKVFKARGVDVKILILMFQQEKKITNTSQVSIIPNQVLKN